MIKSPKEKFLASKVRQEWEKITETQAFEQACDYALMEVIYNMPVASDAHKETQAYNMIVGAHLFIRTLKKIHEQEREQTATEIPTKLNYQAGV
jgi:hypothetical protein